MMYEISDMAGAQMFLDSENECVFSVQYDIGDEYSIYQINQDTYVHHVLYSGCTKWCITVNSEPDRQTVEDFLFRAGIREEIENCSVNTIDVDTDGL